MEDVLFKEQKKEKQKKIRDDLNNQISQKIDNKINEIMFTDNEAKINKKIFESSLSLIESYKS